MHGYHDVPNAYVGKSLAAAPYPSWTPFMMQIRKKSPKIPPQTLLSAHYCLLTVAGLSEYAVPAPL